MTKRNVSLEEVKELALRHSNWGRWGDDDELGTLNFVTEKTIREASGEIQLGRVVSMGLPYDQNGPQTGGLRRFNPIHFMLRDGNDALTGAAIRDFYGGKDGHMAGADDVVIMPLQSGTQWDALSHVIFEGKIYNGYPADLVSSAGARRNDVTVGCTKAVGRGIILDIPRMKQLDALEEGTGISSQDLRDAEDFHGVQVQKGDFVFVRTGHIGACRAKGTWGDYAGGDAAGLNLDSINWMAEKEIAGIITDTWGFEVRPNETSHVNQPLHVICLVHMGLWIGEIFDLEEVSAVAEEVGRASFFFSGPPLPFTGAVGSPLMPLAIF